MQEAVQQASETMAIEDPPELVAARSNLAALVQMQESGAAKGLDTAISDLRRQIDAMSAPMMGPDWTGLSELISVGLGLDSVTDEELRPLLLEYVAEIIYLGNPTEVSVRMNQGPSRD